MCRLSWNLEASTSWNPQGLSRSVIGLIYPYLYYFRATVSTQTGAILAKWKESLQGHSRRRKMSTISGDVTFLCHTGCIPIEVVNKNICHFVGTGLDPWRSSTRKQLLFCPLPEMLSASLARRTSSVRCFSPRWMWQIAQIGISCHRGFCPHRRILRRSSREILHENSTSFRMIFPRIFQPEIELWRKPLLRLTALLNRHNLGWTSQKSGFDSWYGKEIFLFFRVFYMDLGPPVHWVRGQHFFGVKAACLLTYV